MDKRIISLVLFVLMVLSSFPLHVLADEVDYDTYSAEDESNSNLTLNDPVTPGDGNTIPTVIIMQGNTYSASDCVAFENALENSGNGYGYFARHGWYENTPDLVWNSVRVTESQFATIGRYHIAYYSGHGGPSSPVLNYEAQNIVSYGTSDPFNAATVLGVSNNSTWATNCIIDSTDNLKVLVLAACSQLNNTNAKYYARVMKASSLRSVVGYHGTGPGTDEDDDIATNFVQRCDAGYSILNSWYYANTNTSGSDDWAVLVFLNNGEPNYRLPYFNYYTDFTPDPLDSVYRYMNTVSGSVVSTAVASTDSQLLSEIESLPLTISTASVSRSDASQDYLRKPFWTDLAVADDDSAVRELLSKTYNENLSDKLVVQYTVKKEEVDPDSGILPETEVIVGRTYKYYDTYNGIKIVDSYVSGSIDSKGVNAISNNKKTVIAEQPVLTSATERVGSASNMLTKSEALKRILFLDPSVANDELYDAGLAYVPDETGNHVLCYEFMFASGFRYVNVATGAIVKF